MSAAQTLPERSLHWRMLSHTVTVGAFTSLVKLAGALKVIVMARYFGAADALDAFLIAFLLPCFAAEVVGACWTPSIVPILLKTAALRGEAAVDRLARNTLTLCFAFMTAVGLCLAVAGPFVLPLLGSSFGPRKLQLTTGLFFALVAWAPISACTATWRALLNSRDVFAAPALAPLATPVLTLLALWTLASHAGAYALCIGTVLGAIAEALVLAFALSRRGLPVLPAWGGWTPEISAIWKQYLPLMTGSAIASASVITDHAIAGTLGSGSVATLDYGGKLVAVGIAIATTACGTAALPAFARLAAARHWRQLRRSAIAYIGGAVAISVPITALLIWYSRPIVRVVFEHGAFGANATQAVAAVQACALVQVPFALAVALIARLTVALEVSSVLARVAVIAFMANLVGDLVLAYWLGVAGIALSTGLAQAVSVFALIAYLLKLQRRLGA